MFKWTKEEKLLCRLLTKKTLAMGGFTLFSALIALQVSGISNFIPVIYTSFIASGMYFFSELIKYYKIEPEKKVISRSAKRRYNFLL